MAITVLVYRPMQPYLENEVLPSSVHVSTVFMGRLNHFYTGIREESATNLSHISGE